ncbi:MAG: hypothetical protein R3B13_18455 [Polyangiaceae bacterium]
MTALDRDRILALFRALNERLADRDVKGQLFVVGGAVLCLVHRARPATQDVDAVFLPKTELRALAEAMAGEFDVPKNWLNDAVKGYMSDAGTFDPFLELSHLTIMTASAEYLFAMKAIAMRLGAEFHDEGDVRFLLRYLGIQSCADAVALIERYFPPKLIPPKTVAALEEMIEEMLED